MKFRKKNFEIGLSSPNPIRVLVERQQPIIKKDGSSVIEVHYDEVDACDETNFPSLPSPEEYSLSNLMSVPGALEQIPINGIIDDLKSQVDSANAVLSALEQAKVFETKD